MPGAGYEDQLPEGNDQDARMRDAFAQLLMMQEMQRQQQQQGGLPPFNGYGEQEMQRQQPQQGGLPPFNGYGEQGMPMPAPSAGAASDRDMKILEELMRKNKGGPFSLPPSARRFDI